MKHLFAHTLLLLFLLASCSDEELVNGSRPKDGELTEMTFTLCIPQEERVTTRATESDVDELYLLVFNTEADGGTLVEAQPFTNLEEVETSEYGIVLKKKFTAKLKASETAKEIYVVANAQEVLSGTDVLIPGTTTISNIEALTTNATTAPFVMSGHQTSSIPDINLMNDDFILVRSAAKVTMTVGDEAKDEFTYQSFQLWNGNTEGSILAGCTPNDALTRVAENGLIGTAQTGEELYTYPCKNEDNKTFLIVNGLYKGKEYYWRIDLKKKTTIEDETTYTPLDILPNYHYQVIIEKVNNIGYSSAEEAAKHATDNKIEAAIYDIEPNIHSMITDGILELGVTDKVEIHSSDNNSSTGEFFVKVYHREKNLSDLQQEINEKNLITVNASEDDKYWLKNVLLSSTEATKEDADHGQAYLLYTYTFTADANMSGGTREGTIEVKANIDGILLERQIIVEQTAEFLGYEFLKSTTLHVDFIKEDGTLERNTDYSKYWSFLLQLDDAEQKLFGINPDDMGGEIRNEGFHFPVNDKMKFTYTITLPDPTDTNYTYSQIDWRVEVDPRFSNKLEFRDSDGNLIDGFPSGEGISSNQSFSFTTIYPGTSTVTDDNEEQLTQNYRFGRGAFKFILDNTETGRKTVISYDLYHTGIFQYITNAIKNYAVADVPEEGWYYYEVIPMGGRYWLDRNVGATSSGYYIEDSNGNNYLGLTEWPFTNGAASAGALFGITDTDPKDNNNKAKLYNDICPQGYRLPTASEFSTLTSDASFYSEYTPASGGTYWKTYYKYINPSSDESDTREHTSVYFPKNRMFYGGSTSGDANAGYYWTQTEALGTSGNEQGHWMQFMKFMGANASLGRARTTHSGTTGTFGPNPKDKTGMSVRCINDNGNHNETVYTWELYIKGYTHVFLYNKETADSEPVYLNTWPGEMITVDDANALGMYHTFTFSSTTKYTGLYVILNHVTADGKVTTLQAGTDTAKPTGFKVPTTEDDGADINTEGTFIKSFFSNDLIGGKHWNATKPTDGN